MTDSHSMFTCSALLNHVHTKENYALFSKKTGVAADTGALVRSPGGAIQAAHKYFPQPVQSSPVPKSCGEVFMVRIRDRAHNASGIFVGRTLV